MSRSRTVVAFLITHALWLDYDRGSHYSILGLISLLSENVEYAMEVVEMIGDMLFDLAHSFHHVRMPMDNSPLSVKRFIFETLLKLSGHTYFDEKGRPSSVFRKLRIVPIFNSCLNVCVKRYTAYMYMYVHNIHVHVASILLLYYLWLPQANYMCTCNSLKCEVDFIGGYDCSLGSFPNGEIVHAD